MALRELRSVRAEDALEAGTLSTTEPAASISRPAAGTVWAGVMRQGEGAVLRLDGSAWSPKAGVGVGSAKCEGFHIPLPDETPGRESRRYPGPVN